MPPRHGKSELLSHWLPVWYLANWPTKRVGLASYAAEFASEWGRRVRNTIAEHQDAMGNGVAISDDLNRAHQWRLTTGGGLMTAGVGWPFTGYGFDLLIVDDPIKNHEEATSALQRQRLWDWWRSTALTRLEPSGSIIVVMTRWHEDDFVGRLLDSEGEEWDHIRLPALAEPGDPLGRDEGAALWPERYDAEALARLRINVGPQNWPGLFQQRPSRQEGSIFKADWWQYADHIEPNGKVVQFWDTAFKKGEGNDYSVCVTMTTTPNGYGVVDVFRERLEYPDLLREMQTQADRWGPSMVYIEDAASGQSVIQSLKRETRLPVKGIRPVTDKVLRANAVTGLVEAGKVVLPRGAAWLPVFLDEIGGFPTAVHDDQVDAFASCLAQMTRPKWWYEE